MALLQHELGEFTLTAFHNGSFHDVTKKDMLGHWSVVFCYPADFSSLCPTELQDLAAHYEDFKNIGCEIYSVSCDTHFVHKAWRDAEKRLSAIEYPMLADPTGVLVRDLDAYNETSGMAERADFIVTPKGVVVAHEVTLPSVGRNVEELLRRVQACQFVYENEGATCPANWRPSGEMTPTLKSS